MARKIFAEDVTWEDVFYISDLDDGTYPWRKELDENLPHWYNLKIRPNAIRNECRHYTLACGSDYEGKLRTISLYVSTYRTPAEMLRALSMTTDGAKCGKVMLEHYDDWWSEWGETEYVTDYDDDISEAIKKGLRTTIHIGPNVKVTMTKEDDELFIEGRWAEWFEDFVDRVMSFEGHTKEDFYEWLDTGEYCDPEGSKEILIELMKKKHCKSIKTLKSLDMYDWCDVLVPIVNEWEDSTSSENFAINENGEVDEDEE